MRHTWYVAALAAAVGCVDEPAMTRPDVVQARTAIARRYSIEHQPTLGGRITNPSGISNRGWLAGFANLPGNTVRHAALWRDGMVFDLGTLATPGGNANSIVQWPGINNNGMVVGFAETDQPDTLHEQWSCTAFFPAVTGRICLGFYWEGGVMTPLPTLGGNQGFAAGVNNRGQVVGWAETPVVDPTCNAPQVLQFRAVLWEPKAGTTQELPPFPGDSTSAATAINERGDVVGISGDCDVAVGRFSARHAVRWVGGVVDTIGHLGGDAWHTPMDINEQGDIVGFSNPVTIPGAGFAPLAFLWTRERGIQSLGALDDDTTSQAVGINDRREVVGVSCGRRAGCRAFLWLDDGGAGVMLHLDSLVTPGYPHRLRVAQHINDAGQITGRAIIAGTTTQVPFVMTPAESP